MVFGRWFNSENHATFCRWLLEMITNTPHGFQPHTTNIDPLFPFRFNSRIWVSDNSMKQSKNQCLFPTICLCFSLWTLILCGCPTTAHFESVYASWVGTPLIKFEAAYGPAEQVSTAPNGNRIFKYDLAQQKIKKCIIYWTVEKNGVIVGWRHEGIGCVIAPFS